MEGKRKKERDKVRREGQDTSAKAVRGETESLLVEVGVKSLGPEICCFLLASGYCGT